MTDFANTRAVQATAPKDMFTLVHRCLVLVLRFAAKRPAERLKSFDDRTPAERSFDAAVYREEARRKADRLLFR